MEDKISRTNEDSWSKDLAEICSILQELVATSKPTSMEFQRFCGENPEAGIVQAEHYLDFYKIEEDQKLNMVSFYLDGEALKWYQWLFRNNQLIDWPHFVDKVRIRFKQRGYVFVEGRFPNLGQVTYVTDQNHCEDILSSFGEADVLFPGYAYVHPQWSNITHSLVPQYHGEQTKCKSNTNARKVFDELPDRYKDANPLGTSSKPIELLISPDRYKDANPLGTSSKPIELSISPNDLVNYVSRIAVVNGCNDDAKNEDEDDEEEIVTIREEPVELVIANDKPSLWINSTLPIPCDLSMFDIHKVLDNCWNQLFVGHFEKVFSLELAQRWEEKPSIPSTCSFAKLINRGITDHLCGLSHVAVNFTLHLFPPDQFGLECPFDLRSSYILCSLELQEILYFSWLLKFTMSTLWNSCNWCDTGQDAPQLISGDAHRKYICSFKSNHNEQNLSNFTINCSSLFNNLRMGCLQFATRRTEELRPSYFLVSHVNQKGGYILGLTDMLGTIAYSYSLTEVWDPGRHLLVNSYVSKIVENKIDGVDISDILLQADKGGTNDSPVEGSNRFWFCLSPKLFIFRLQKIHISGHRALLCNIHFAFLELQCKELLQHMEMGNSWICGSACWISLTMWLDIHNSFSFLEPNLEDKVLIEGGSIVVTRVGSVMAYGLELVKETDLVGTIGPSKMLESLVWDPSPLSN